VPAEKVGELQSPLTLWVRPVVVRSRPDPLVAGMARLALGDLDNSPQPVGTGEQAADDAGGPMTASIDALRRQLLVVIPVRQRARSRATGSEWCSSTRPARMFRSEMCMSTISRGPPAS
jgi:hypothetical protein